MPPSSILPICIAISKLFHRCEIEFRPEKHFCIPRPDCQNHVHLFLALQGAVQNKFRQGSQTVVSGLLQVWKIETLHIPRNLVAALEIEKVARQC